MQTLGRVRILPHDTPGLPPAVPDDENGGYQDEIACMVTVWATDSPEVMEFLNDAEAGAYCTRPKHLEYEIHVSRMRDEYTSMPLAIVVWGGE